jgi:hypothetical protein
MIFARSVPRKRASVATVREWDTKTAGHWMPILGGRLKSPILHGEDRMIGEVKITRLHHAEVERVTALIDRKDDVGIARFSLP